MGHLAAVLLLVVAAWPDPLVLDPSGPGASAEGHVEVVEDAGGRLSLDEARGLERYAPLGPGAFGAADGRRYWARLALASPASRPTSWVLPLGVRSATATVVRADGRRETHRTGWGLPLGEWTDVLGGVPAVRVDLGPRERVELYVQVENGVGYATPTPLTVTELGAFEARQRRGHALQMAFLGVCLALSVYKLFLFASFRDPSYLYYVAFLVGAAVYWATAGGYTVPFLLGLTGRGWPALNFYGLAVAALAYGQFVRHYLETPRHAPRLDRVLIGVSGLWAVSVALSVAGAWTAGTTVAALAGLALVVVSFAAGVASVRVGFRPARDYLIAASPFLFVSVGYIALYFADPSLAGSARPALQVAMLVEAVLLARALSLRIQTLSAERTAAVAAHQAAEAGRTALEEMSAFKSRMLEVAAHDLRGPLGTIIGFADMIAFETPDRPDLRDYTDPIQRSAGRMLDLIDGLLGRAALDAKDFELAPSRVDLCALVRETAEDHRARSVEKAQTLSVRAPARAYAEVDPERIRAVLDNLVSNAVKYTPTGGSVELTVTAVETAVEVRVSDSGPGFTAEDREQLFEPFQRLSARPTGGETSTGLGLSIVKQIVDLHGGRIEVESEPGAGAAFVVTLDTMGRPADAGLGRRPDAIALRDGVSEPAAEPADVVA